MLAAINGQNSKTLHNVSFMKKEKKADSGVQKEGAKLMYEEKKNHPLSTGLMIQGNKLKNAFTVYPYKGMIGSKNSNFYEFLTMGIMPYLIGSGMMAAVFGAASRFFDTPDAISAGKTAKKAALGVIFYGIFKTLSKKFIETPLNLKYGIDVNVPYRKKIDELPEERNKGSLVSYEYHKAYESVDFPYWSLFSDNKAFGEKRNSYFESVGRKMGFSDEELKTKLQDCLRAARQGAVLVSPAISQGEKAIMRAAFEEGLPLIYLQENGFTDLAKPGGKRMEACAKGQLLILAPWEHHNEKIAIKRGLCLKLNEMARIICDGG